NPKTNQSHRESGVTNMHEFSDSTKARKSLIARSRWQTAFLLLYFALVGRVAGDDHQRCNIPEVNLEVILDSQITFNGSAPSAGKMPDGAKGLVFPSMLTGEDSPQAVTKTIKSFLKSNNRFPRAETFDWNSAERRVKIKVSRIAGDQGPEKALVLEIDKDS